MHDIIVDIKLRGSVHVCACVFPVAIFSVPEMVNKVKYKIKEQDKIHTKNFRK